MMKNAVIVTTNSPHQRTTLLYQWFLKLSKMLSFDAGGLPSCWVPLLACPAVRITRVVCRRGRLYELL